MAGGRGKKRRRQRVPRATPPGREPGDAGKQAAVSTGSSARRSDPGLTRPEAPWGSFPLAELLVLAGIVFLIWGAIGARPVAITVGLGLASLGGLELSIREHFGGFRSHSLLLAGVAAVATIAAVAYLTELILAICLGLGAAVFVACFFMLRRAFQRASGGYSFRIGGFKG